MEFGRVGNDSLNSISFNLPAEPESNKRIIANGRETCHFYLGAPVFGFKEWVGDFYPLRTTSGDFLKHYGRQCNALEFNGFYYGVPPKVPLKSG